MADDWANDVALSTDPQRCSVADALFVQEVIRREAPLVKSVGWTTATSDISALEEADGCEVVTVADHGPRLSALFRLGGSIVSMWIAEGTFGARIAGDESSCAESLAFLEQSVPRQQPRHLEVPITFWLRTHQGDPHQIIRPLNVPAWQDISDNYSHATRAALTSLMSDFRPTHGGQLLLWHGDPGTGKTFGIRSLAWEWRKWCDLHYIVDPDRFFEAADYMMTVLLQVHDFGHGPKNRWRLLVLEDAGEMIRADAKERVGQGLSRLLNVVDGLIGQGLRILLLITTNEKVGELHAAVARPGRCAADVDFTSLEPDDVRTWLQEHGGNPELTPTDPVRLADLYALLGPPPEGHHPGRTVLV